MADGMGPLDPLMFARFRRWLDRWAPDVRVRYAGLHDIEVGGDVEIYRPSNVYGCSIGWHVRIGPFVEIQRGVKIGSYVKIGSHSFICAGVTIQDRVFIGHGVTFCNDRYPRATLDCDAIRERVQLKKAEDWHCQGVLVKYGASIGSGATIIPGVSIGSYAMIGAGAVVTKDVPTGEIWAGNPARRIGLTEEGKRYVAFANARKT